MRPHHARIALLAQAMGSMLLIPGILLAAPPQTQQLESTHLVIGDAFPAIRQALHTTEPATDSKGGDVEIGSELHLPERGIWVFFDGMSLARQYRFDAPFAGDIHGARIGASIDQVRKALGAPVKDITYTVAFGKAYLYRPDGGTTIRCDFDRMHKLTTIRVLGGEVTFIEPPTPGH